MFKVPVHSSNIKEVWQEDNKLYVTFKNERTYTYEPFSWEEFNKMLKHDKGISVYFREQIKNNKKYKYKEL